MRTVEHDCIGEKQVAVTRRSFSDLDSGDGDRRAVRCRIQLAHGPRRSARPHAAYPSRRGRLCRQLESVAPSADTGLSPAIQADLFTRFHRFSRAGAVQRHKDTQWA